MKQLLIIFASLIFLAATGCKEDECESTYNINLQVINGTTGEPYVGSTYVMDVREDKPFGPDDRVRIGSGKTDSEGRINFTYDCVNLDGEIRFLLDNFETTLPKNQDITDKIIYFSPEGSFDVYIKLKEPLQPNDTLFVSSAASFDINDVKIDTFINPSEGFFKNIRTPNKSYNLFWGRSSNTGNGKFIFDAEQDTFGSKTPKMKVSVSGDPYKDKLELEF